MNQIRKSTAFAIILSLLLGIFARVSITGATPTATAGDLFAWGNNYHGQLGRSTSGTTPAQVNGVTGVVDIAGGAGHSLALKSDGTVWAWGHNYNGQLGASTAPLVHSQARR